MTERDQLMRPNSMLRVPLFQKFLDLCLIEQVNSIEQNGSFGPLSCLFGSTETGPPVEVVRKYIKAQIFLQIPIDLVHENFLSLLEAS